MTKVDIFSGFLGAGKTTLIKKLIKEAYAGERLVLIENEFGQIGIDGGFLSEAGINVTEMNSGCICCSLVGVFGASLKEVLDTYQPERVLIEPSGVGKLSDVMKAVEDVKAEDVQLNSAVAVVDASKAKLYIKNFGEFFVNQIEHAGTIILSRTGTMKQEKIEQAVAMIREHNEKATIITTPWDDIDGKDILSTIEGAKDLEAELMAEVLHHHEHHHDHDEHCTCGCHDHQHEHEECHHDHHHHEHDEHCTCGCHDHHHDHHHADEVFGSLGYETPAKYEKADIEHILEEIENEKTYGIVLRAKGMVPSPDGSWIYFDYVPGEANVRNGKPDVTGKICVIGSGLKEDALKELFAK